jgi:bla regulator protein BlaR1
MTEFFDSARVLVHGDLPRILFDAAVKGAVLLILATAIAFALRRASASLRHLLWSLSIAALVALPLLAALAPQWSVPGLPTLAPAESIPAAGSNASPAPSESPVPKLTPFAAPPEERGERRPSAKPTPDVSFVSRSLQGQAAGEQAENDTLSIAATAAGASTELASARSTVQSSTPVSAKPVPGRRGFALPWTAWAAILWATVATVVLAGIGLGVLRTWLIGRKARRLSSGALVHLADELSARLGLRRRVSLLQSSDCCMPLTWGVIKPRILLPADVIAWPTARLRAVLLHELAHVKRFDYLTHLLARFACAVHWFNPLVWHAANKVREESELACDDQVLRSGSLPSEYAGHLLELARSLKAHPLTSLATMGVRARS